MRPEKQMTNLAARRAHLRAAGRHVALGHESPSFRDCSHPLCCDAAGRVPYLNEDAEQPVIDLIFDRVQAALKVGPSPPRRRLHRHDI